ncbi:hypothetical protein KXD40_003909 [Peronospora effusa]|uniref:Uncharacterized protein n=1 Tax=Peronospora effusa TaxID=542832 RepID=A0A3M6VW37_9STRA|nr:hypothetical protein DD238_000215 [Peronospora effusa]UIZ22913.1 hypothetical protein KXD40_003909 [Peronospora effusa]CAI5703119.1 unnamed protein product [Peronospora effusa]
MTTSSSVSALNSRQLQEPRPRRLDPHRHQSLPKITGRKLRTPRKFVVTDVSDEELDALKPSALLSAMSDVAGRQRDDNENDHSNSEDLSASSSLVRKGKTQIKGRFTITDLSPESSEIPSGREDMSVSMGPTPSRVLEASRRTSRKMASRRPFQSAGDARPSVGLTNASLSQPQQETPLIASFQRPEVSSPSSQSLRPSLPAHAMNKQVIQFNYPTQTVFDNHLEFLAKETSEMKLALEKMVATNAHWIEALTSAGLAQGRLWEATVSEPASAARPPFEQMYRGLEKAYMELQPKYDAVCQKSERMEVKNAMLEIRLQQQINRSSMLRSQLDKLTQYTEKLICESSEPTLHDYNSDLNSIFGEHSEAHSPTAEMTSGGDYGFNDNVLKSRRQRWHDLDEECMSNTNTEGEPLRKTSSPLPNVNNRYCSDKERKTVDSSSANNRGSSKAVSLLLDDQVKELRESLQLKKEVADEPVSVIDSSDSMAVCPSVTNFEPNGDDDCDVNDSILLPNKLHTDLLKHSDSVVLLNDSTVSSTSSLAGYGLHLASMAQSKSGYVCSIAATSLFGPHPEPYPNASSHPNGSQDDDTIYNVLSPENLRFHDCRSLLEAAEERNLQTSSRRHSFFFTTGRKTSSLPEASEASERTQSTGSLFQRFAVRRQKPVV